MGRIFNIAGPCKAGKHDMLPALVRFPEARLVVFDPDLTKPWEGKISSEDISWNDKTVHVVRC